MLRRAGVVLALALALSPTVALADVLVPTSGYGYIADGSIPTSGGPLGGGDFLSGSIIKSDENVKSEYDSVNLSFRFHTDTISNSTGTVTGQIHDLQSAESGYTLDGLFYVWTAPYSFTGNEVAHFYTPIGLKKGWTASFSLNPRIGFRFPSLSLGAYITSTAGDSSGVLWARSPDGRWHILSHSLTWSGELPYDVTHVGWSWHAAIKQVGALTYGYGIIPPTIMWSDVEGAFSEQTKDLSSTDGSGSVINNVTRRFSQDSATSRLGFVGDVIKIPLKVFSAISSAGERSTISFPGVSVPGVPFSLPATEVDVWSSLPSLKEPVRFVCTLGFLLAWIKGVQAIYGRIFHGGDDEQ